MNGRELKAWRVARGYSLTDMANAFHVDRRTYMRWETGQSQMRGPVYVLADLLERDVIPPATMGL